MSEEVDSDLARDSTPELPGPRWRRVVHRFVDRLTAEREATVDAVVEAPTPLQPIDLADDAKVTQVLELAERVGEVVLASGTAVTDTTTQVEFIAATYGLAQCDIDVTYNSIRISADRGPTLPPASTMRVVRYRSLDFTRLAAVDRLTRRIRREVVPPEDAHAALDTITTAPHPYNRWVATAGWSLLAASVALLLGGGILVAATSFVGTAMIDRANRELNKRGLPFFFQHMAGGAIATVPAIVLATFAGRIEANPSLVVAAGITVLLSGLQLVGAVEDAITGAPITAAARSLEVVMMTAGIIAGVALALRVADLLHAVVPMIDMTSSRDIDNLPLKVAAGAVASMAFALACYAELRALAAAAFSGAAATVCYLVVQHSGFGPVVSSGVAATAVGLAGGLMARRSLTPPLVVAVAGITPLLPGLRLYRGLQALLNSEQLMGLNQLFGAFTVGCALAAGVTLGEWIARFLRRPRIMRRFQGIRHPMPGQ
ncbi:threonine/serine exporter family protein [Nocardia terpenica]|uniref:threonine/serine ThrE exporter family protein n=1 Tax=Nocardia terpenica TaxID=455432 RepID=UPI0009ECE6D7|nr:threonine/serine exporter family protein [Nocardia terpenica]MBF6064275.1 threonine/serine exporter family protein [Nocardia terpenica]MBF6106608.1 threonine/serine exporter family protein [Nocardia terpenica]MBF6113893.1 threonine/serine exporter family protein [Nocardia terpenica]MBF6120483.1 threonine/serine exporter family protein [Nocardia terpenica]MBF6154860.1 threonine/serine exporter family protein [Nocardia terpenica]